MLLLTSTIKEITLYRRLLSLIKGDYSEKLQDQPFKICKNWMLAYNGWRRNSDNCSSHYLNIINQRPKYPHLFIKWVVQVYIYLWSLAFSLYLLTLLKCSHHQQWFKQMHILKIVLIIWQSRSRFMVCMAVNVR